MRLGTRKDPVSWVVSQVTQKREFSSSIAIPQVGCHVRNLEDTKFAKANSGSFRSGTVELRESSISILVRSGEFLRHQVVKSKSLTIT